MSEWLWLPALLVLPAVTGLLRGNRTAAVDMYTDPARAEYISPASKPNCRFGYAEQHATFALLHVAVLGRCLYKAPRAPQLLRGLFAAGTACIAAFHVLLGGMCSPAVLVYVRFPLLRLWVVNGLAVSGVAAHFVALKSKGAVRVFFSSTSRSMPTANAEDPCRSECTYRPFRRHPPRFDRAPRRSPSARPEKVRRVWRSSSS